MKNVGLFTILFFTGMFLFLSGCQKDDAVFSIGDRQGQLRQLPNWSDTQKKFFNINHNVSKKSLVDDFVSNRMTTINWSDSTFVRFYNKLVELDEKQNVVAKIADIVGAPFWRRASILENKPDKSATFYVPLGFANGNKTEALISALEYEENGVKKYLLKLTERKDIEAVFADEDKLATYNNFGIEAMMFIANDYFVYQDNYAAFVSGIKAFRDSGIDLQGGQNDNMWSQLRAGTGSRSNCNCQLRVGEFLMDGAGNIIKELGSELGIGGPSDGWGANGTGGGNNGTGGSGSDDGDRSGGTIGSGTSTFGFGNLFGIDGGNSSGSGGNTGNSGTSTGGSGNNTGGSGNNTGGSGGNTGGGNSGGITPMTFGGGIMGFILWYIYVYSHRQPTFHDGGIVSGRDIDQNIVTQIYVDCGQDGFKSDDLIVGDVEAGKAVMRALKAGNLDCGDSRCLMKNTRLFDAVDAFLAQNYINPCTGGELNLDEAIEAAIKEACDADGRQSATLFNTMMQAELDKMDYITNRLGNCPKANCMLEKLINVTGINICTAINLFDAPTDTNFGVDIFTENLPPTGNGIVPFAETRYQSGESNIVLDINRICNEDKPLIIAETILHEMIHALFFESMEKLGWNGSNDTKNEYFDILINNWMSESPGMTHHEIMTLYYLEPMANTLWNLNNQLGDAKDYYGLILYGLNSKEGGVNRVIRDQFSLNDQDILNAYATSLNIVVNPSSLNFENCD